MIPLSSPTETELTHDSIASLRVRASYSQLPTLRGITRTVANNTGLDIDGTADLALAMDEVASILIGHAIPSSDLTCRFDTVGRTLRTVVSVIAHSEIPDKSHSFGWFVLEALVDSVRLEQSEIDADGHITLTMTLEKGLPQERA